MATQKVAKVGVKKESGYLYFVDKNGDVSCAKMARGNQKGGKATKVAKVGLKKKPGFLYFYCVFPVQPLFYPFFALFFFFNSFT